MKRPLRLLGETLLEVQNLVKHFPINITQTRCTVSAMTPRSWVMRMTAIPNSSLRRTIRSMICAWMVTSSAGRRLVGDEEVWVAC